MRNTVVRGKDVTVRKWWRVVSMRVMTELVWGDYNSWKGKDGPLMSVRMTKRMEREEWIVDVSGNDEEDGEGEVDVGEGNREDGEGGVDVMMTSTTEKSA